MKKIIPLLFIAAVLLLSSCTIFIGDLDDPMIRFRNASGEAVKMSIGTYTPITSTTGDFDPERTYTVLYTGDSQTSEYFTLDADTWDLAYIPWLGGVWDTTYYYTGKYDFKAGKTYTLSFSYTGVGSDTGTFTVIEED